MGRAITGTLFKRQGKKSTWQKENRNAVWWLKYTVHGKTFALSLDTANLEKAMKKRDEKLRPLTVLDEVQRQREVAAALQTVEEQVEALTAYIPMEDAFERFAQKPRRVPLTPAGRAFKEAAWRDFTAFIKARHPDTKTLNGITTSMAEAYLHHLHTRGRFIRKVEFQRGGRTLDYKREIGAASPRTVNAYHQVLGEVFGRLAEDSKLKGNPFASVGKAKLQTTARETFTPAELRLIAEKADPFVFALFMVGANTGLREGDICTLRWSEVALDKGLIVRESMRKTGKTVRIPILSALRQYLAALPRDGEYVLPEHAAMYLHNRTGVSWRVRDFLDDIGITTTFKPDGRSRAVSVKDVHSLRHTFIYNAASAGVPFHVVRAIVGHVDPKMTEQYAAHVQDELAQAKLATMKSPFEAPRALPAPADLEAVAKVRRELQAAMEKIEDVTKLQTALAALTA